MNTTANGRELTLKEINTASLLSRLEQLESTYRAAVAEIEAIERELEERAEWEQKASRW